MGDDLQTAIMISLFTDGVAKPDDKLDESYRRGWWEIQEIITTLALVCGYWIEKTN